MSERDIPAGERLLTAWRGQWTAQHGALEGVSNFLRGLGEDQWFHLGE
jgi:hypothetical protein